MIAKLTGFLDSLDNGTLVLDVNGVGYSVLVHDRITRSLQHCLAQEVSFFIEPLLRQEQLLLCGFLEKEEKEWFRLFLTVQGVGVKAALALLSRFPGREIAEIIAREDSRMLCQAEGVGPKLANRLASELKEKVLKIFTLTAAPPAPRQILIANRPTFMDSLTALLHLGYNRNEATLALNQSFDEALTTAELVQKALQSLGRTTLTRG